MGLSNEQLEEIRQNADYVEREYGHHSSAISELAEDVPKLLTEIEQLKSDKSRLVNELMKADERTVHMLMPFIK